MPPLALATLFLAQVQPAAAPTAASVPLDAGNPIVFMGLLVGAGLTILTVVDKIDGMVQRRKRVPSVEAEFARKDEVAALDMRRREEIAALDKRLTDEMNGLKNTIGATSGKLDLLALSINKEFKDLALLIGNLQGKIG